MKTREGLVFPPRLALVNKDTCRDILITYVYLPYCGSYLIKECFFSICYPNTHFIFTIISQSTTVLLSLFCRWGNWSSENLSGLPRPTEPVSVEAGIHITLYLVGIQFILNLPSLRGSMHFSELDCEYIHQLLFYGRILS